MAELPEGVETEQGDADFGSEPDPATWRRIKFRAEKSDGSFADVELLRAVAWLAEREAEVGGRVDIAVPECGIDGRAEIQAIEPCPPIPPGPGRVVTGTFKHQSAAVVDVHVTGLPAPIGTTANHPFWSEDRQAFVRADELLPGERLRTLAGTPEVLAVVSRASPEPVYNLEVQYAHVYHVDTTGVLVHNAVTCKTLANNSPAGGQYRGGLHGDVKNPVGDGFDSHHMPARQASPLDADAGPAIQMAPRDHRRTASYGGGPNSPQQAYRDTQRKLIEDGRFEDAFLMDVDDMQSKFGNKYDDAILEAIDVLP